MRRLLKSALRWLILCCALQLVVNSPAFADSNATECPSIGVIRWDAWFGSKGIPGQAVERTLGPKQWHNRLPSCARINGDNSVSIDCETEAQIIKEAQLAKTAGISYWAFVTYEDDDPMSQGFNYYIKSNAQQLVNFSIISELARWGDSTRYKKVIEKFAKLMVHPAYQRTPSGRPLFFLGFVSDDAIAKRFGSRTELSKAIKELREQTIRAGAENPFIVLLDRDVEKAEGLIRELGLDAISAYAVADIRVQDGEFSQLANLTENFWKRASGSGLQLLPIAMTGWDRRPRIENPVPWEKGRSSPDQMRHFYRQPTMKELQDHLSSALRTAISNTTRDSARSILVYAWNEFDEGGWLAPTYGEGTQRLDAVRHALGVACPSGTGTRR